MKAATLRAMGNLGRYELLLIIEVALMLLATRWIRIR
jgi:hypothetical protein